MKNLQSAVKLMFRFSLLTGVVTLSACSSGHSVNLIPDHDVVVEVSRSDGSVSESRVKAGDRFEIKDPFAKISAEGRISAIYVSESELKGASQPNDWKLSLPPVTTLKPIDSDRVLAKDIDDFYTATIQVIELSRSKKYKNALQKIDQMLARYPNLSSGHYLKAEVLAASGARQEAIQSLESALRVRPDFTQASDLLKKLKGKD